MVKKQVGKSETVKKVLLTVGIAILFTMFIFYAIETAYPSPKYVDFCGEFQTAEFIENANRCSEVGGKWENYAQPIPEGKTNVTGWCDRDYTCRQEYQTQQDKYDRNVFFVSFILGILIIIASLFVSISAISNGLMASGFLTAIIANIRFWGELSNLWRTLMLALGLAILFYIGYKKLN